MEEGEVVVVVPERTVHVDELYPGAKSKAVVHKFEVCSRVFVDHSTVVYCTLVFIRDSVMFSHNDEYDW